jgi:hypothetical protein
MIILERSEIRDLGFAMSPFRIAQYDVYIDSV